MSTSLCFSSAGSVSPALIPRMANRHGLIAGATGTGKTITLQVMAERFSALGVPVFLADVKGDLSGMAAAGEPSARVLQRFEALGLGEFMPAACPVEFWDVFGEAGTPIRATVSDMGPLLLARLLSLNDTQAGVLQLVFKIADDEGLLLIDLKDLRAMLQYVGENAARFRGQYGNVSSVSIGAIQRGLLGLETQGGDRFFGEPMLDIQDFLTHDDRGRGVVNILSAEQLVHRPALYASFLLWLLSELFEQLPEVGDMDKPRLVFFFDEAHLLFADAPKALVDKVELVVRLIRSKGVGVYFVTQNPMDVPEKILGQLGNRVQHALRAFTPRDQRAVAAAAATMRPNPAFSSEAAITELGVGEALVSLLDAEGRPGVVERAMIHPPASRIGPLPDADRHRLIEASPRRRRYAETVDRVSAYEQLQAPGAVAPTEDPAVPARAEAGTSRGREGLMEAAAKSVLRGVAGTVGREIGRQILRGVLGSILGGRR